MRWRNGVRVAGVTIVGFVLTAGIVTSASATPAVSVGSSAKQIKLGKTASLKIKARGIANAELNAYSYKIEQAPFPYKKWQVSREVSDLPATSFSAQVNPRINTKFRVTLESKLDDSQVRSAPVRIYVNGASLLRSSPLRRNRVRFRLKLSFDRSFAEKYRQLPVKQRKVYVYQACGNRSVPSTNYRLIATSPVPVKVSGKVARLEWKATIQVNCQGFSRYFWFAIGVFILPDMQPNGDDGYGKPSSTRRAEEKALRLSGRKRLSPKQVRLLLRN